MTAQGAWPLAPPLPGELQVEVTAACNLRCPMCLVRYRPPLDRVRHSLPLERFRALVEANPDVRRITLQGLGEPLLTPNLLDMVELAASRGIEVGFNTNATLLTRERAERLVRAGLAWLHVSFDGATKATYEAIRDGARFERVVANVAGLVEVKRRLGGDRPWVRLVFVAMRRNVAELPGVVRIAAETGVNEVWVQHLSHSFDDTDGSGDGAYVEIRRYTAAEALWDAAPAPFAEAREVAEALGVALRLPPIGDDPPPAPRRPGEPGCDWPWRSGYVTHDGTLQPCCMVMGADRAPLGHLDATSFAEAWAGEPYRRFREALLGDEPPEVCRGCSMYHHRF
ncbi:MAG TPA: radical SAM protein [Acidimicrobiales bacterium]|jgi:radical SAM protein with 4Fe4S-binding SPASM domain